MITRARTLPIGAEILSGRGTHFRVWAPAARSVELRIETTQGGVRSRVPLEPEARLPSQPVDLPGTRRFEDRSKYGCRHAISCLPCGKERYTKARIR